MVAIELMSHELRPLEQQQKLDWEFFINNLKTRTNESI